MLIQLDDKMDFSMMKRGTDKPAGQNRLNLKPTENRLPITWNEKGENVLVSYYRKKDGKWEYKRPSDITDEERVAGGWSSQYERSMRVGKKRDRIIERGNELIIRLLGLSDDDENTLESRYRLAVDALNEVKGKYYEYNNRGGDERSKREATRNFLNRHFKPKLYEYDILFYDKELGKQVKEYFEQKEKVKITGNTVYICGYDSSLKQSDKTSAKIYEHSECHGWKETGYYKLEITFGRKVFEEVEAELKNLTSQEAIIDRLRPKIGAWLQRNLKGELYMEILKRVSEENTVLARVIRLEKTVEKQYRDTDGKMKDLEKRITELEKQGKRVL